MIKYIIPILAFMSLISCDSGNRDIQFNGRIYAPISLFSKNDSIEGYIGVYNDTLFFTVKNFKKSYSVFPFLILNDTQSTIINTIYLEQPLSCVNNYRITVNKVEYQKEDTVFYFTHHTLDLITINSMIDTNSRSMNLTETQLKEILKFGGKKEFVYSTKRGFIGFNGYKVSSFCFPYEN